jgi:hypothetical protein
MRKYMMMTVVIMVAISAFGATIVVPTDQPTIAAAIAAANAMDQIELEPGTYTEPGLVITQDLTIRAQNWGAPENHIIQAAATPGTATDRVFIITGGRVSLQGLTIRHGNVADDGGAIHVSGAGTILSVNECIVNDNAAIAGRGGAVYSNQASVDFWECEVTGNTAFGNGGGIFASGGGMNISRCTVAGNQGTDGGGIWLADCNAWVLDNAITGNSASGDGGGIYLDLALAGFNAYFTNSTLSGNSAGRGGGIYTAASGSTPTLRHLTVASNSASLAPNQGGGIFAAGPVAPDLRACIVADNTATSGPDIYGAVNSLDYNLIENITDATVTGTTTSNIVGSDPLLLPLAANGGPTMTHALQTGSPALDQIPQAEFTDWQDQRQAPRNQTTSPDGDIGAYELFVDEWGANIINCWQQAPPDNDTIQIMVGFNQLAINFNDISDLVIVTTGTLTYTGASGFMGGMNFAVTLEGVTGTGTITISVNPASDVVTPFGAPLTTSVTSDPFFSDNDPPTISISAPNPAQTEVGPVEYTVTYSGADTVTLTGTDITLDATGDATGSVVLTPLGGDEYSVTLLGITGTGTLGFTIAPGTASDLAGNQAAGATSALATIGMPMPVGAWPAFLALAAAGAVAARRKQKK